jgi:uncharacterized protein (DUF111 family)
MGLSYWQIQERVRESGKELEVKRLAIELQHQFSEPNSRVKYKDAYEMAYHEVFLSVV